MSEQTDALSLARSALEEREATIDTLRQALEIIAVGDSQNPRADAAEALRSAGLWKPELARSVLNKENGTSGAEGPDA